MASRTKLYAAPTMKPASLFFAKPTRRVLRKLPTVLPQPKISLDALSDALADDVAHRASGAPIDGGAAVALEVLSDMRCDAELSTSFDEAADIVALVTADCNSARARYLLQHRQCVAPFGLAVGLIDS